MDRKLPENQEIRRLIELSASCRRLLENEAAVLKHKLDIPSRVRHSLKENPSTWVAGSLVSGLAASLLFRSKPAPQKKRRGIPSAILGLTLTAARPLLKVWLANQVKQLVTGNPSNPITDQLPPKAVSPSKSF